MIDFRPDSGAETATALVPEPGEGVHGAVSSYAVEVPYSVENPCAAQEG